MNWRGKRVLVTGAAGFIGRHLVSQLVRQGAEVTGFVRYNSKEETRLDTLPNGVDGAAVRIVAGDLKDSHAVCRAVRGQQVVFHLGALIGIPYSFIHPLDYVQTNILGTTSILNASLEFGVEKLLVTSTSEVYGTALYVPIDEEHPLQAQSPYAASKIAADQLALSYFRSFDLPVALVRPFNTYGPGQSTRAVIPTIIAQGLSGDTLRLGSLTPRRDLMFVEDTATGMLRIAEVAEAVGEVINLGTGQDISIGELADKIFRKLGRQAHISLDDQRLRPEKSEVQRLLAQTEKAQRLLNWSACHSLDEGLDKTITWFRDNPASVHAHRYLV